MIARSSFCASVVIWHQTPRCFDAVYRCEILLRGILAIIINKEDPGALMGKQRDDSPRGSSARIFFIYIRNPDLQNVYKSQCGRRSVSTKIHIRWILKCTHCALWSSHRTIFLISKGTNMRGAAVCVKLHRAIVLALLSGSIHHESGEITQHLKFIWQINTQPAIVSNRIGFLIKAQCQPQQMVMTHLIKGWEMIVLFGKWLLNVERNYLQILPPHGGWGWAVVPRLMFGAYMSINTP